MIVYRAMSKKERDLTLEHNDFAFDKKRKYFSFNLDWIKSRVMDGNFNNSKFKTERYKHLLKFEIDDEYIIQFSKVGEKELMLHKWKSNFPIKNISEIENGPVTQQDRVLP